MKHLKSIIFLIISLLLFSCISEEGEGGIATVQGYVYTVLHDDDIYSFQADTFPAAKTDVFIVYGEEPIYGDKMETGYDGFYRFRYLTKGMYKVYAYSTMPNSQKVAVIDSVSVAYGETKNVDNIYVHEGKATETSYIKGTVLVRYYDKDRFVSDLIPANDIRVYIKRKDAPYHFDEVRTGYDGVFMFQGLDTGDYEVFVLTEQIKEKILTPILQSVSVSEKGIIVTIPTSFQIIINA